MNRNRRVWLGVSSLLVAVQGTGCALDTGARIRVSMPGSASSQNLMSFSSSAASMMMGPPAPAAYADFHCFGLNVTGPGISPSPLCSNDPAAGALGGFSPFSGGTVDVRVQPGSSRKIQLLGVMTDDASCPSLASMNPQDPSGPAISAFLLGETTTDVFEDKRVTIQAAYTDVANAIPILEQCGDAGGGGGMPNPNWFSGFMGFWLNPSADSTGGPLASWASSGPQPVTFIQGTGTNQPSRMLDAGGPGTHLISFADNYRNMVSSDAMPALANPVAITLFTVIQVPAVPGSSTLFSLNYAGTQTLILTIAPSTGILTATGTSLSADTETTPGLNTNLPTLVQVTWTPGTGSGVVMRVNGGAAIDANATVNSSAFSSTVNNAMFGSAASAPTGVFLGDLVVYGTEFANPEREQLECYFKGKYLIAGISNSQCP